MAMMQVTKPKSLADKIEKQTSEKIIPHMVSNFGFVDYQGSISLQVLKWPNSDPCKLPADFEQVKEKISKDLQGKGSYGFLVEYAALKCTVATQALNMLKLGAKTGLVYVEKTMHPQAMTNYVNIKEGIKYPPMNYIGNEQGQLILEAIEGGEKVEINIDYEMKKYSGDLTAVFWYSFDNPDSLNIMKHMIERQVPLKDLVDFNYVFKIYSAEEVGLEGASKKKIQRYCYGEGTYCVKPSKDIASLRNPRELILEGLKLTCITETAEKYYFLNSMAANYVDSLRNKCILNDELESCSDDLVSLFKDHVKKDPETAKEFDSCLQEISKIKQEPEEMHPALDYIHVQNHQYGKYDVVPSLFVNNQLVGGTLSGALALSAVCDSLSRPPSYCSDLEHNIRNLRDEAQGEIEGDLVRGASGGLFFVKLIIVFGSLVLLVLLLLGGIKFYENLMKRDIGTEIYTQIGTVERLPPIQNNRPERLDTTA